MWENAYLSIKNAKAFLAPLRYIGNFRSQNLGPLPLDQILDPHLRTALYVISGYE